MDYYTQKAKRMYELYLKGESCKKVYAAVRKGDKYVVIENGEGKKYKYQIAGGSVEDGESSQEAIIREVCEELNINARIIKSLGVTNYTSNWEYDNKKFSINNKVEVFLLDFVSYADHDKLGLEGENVNNIVLISKEEMCDNVYEFTKGGITFKK